MLMKIEGNFMNEKMKRKILLAKVLLVLWCIGTLWENCECKSVGSVELTTKSYLDEDERQVPETTTDFPKTTPREKVNFDAETFNYTSYFHSNTNRSLYEELKEATTSYPKHDELFDELLGTAAATTTEGSDGDENASTNEIKMHSFEDETSIEKKFHDDESGFRNNKTKEERRLLTEGVIDEETIKYDHKMSELVKVDDSNETQERSTTPNTGTVVSVSSTKKGKHLDLLQSESDNVNMTIPNVAEVWTLAGMKNVAPTSGKPQNFNNQNGETAPENVNNHHHNTKMNSNAKNLLDWSEIAKMSDLRVAQSNETETNSSTSAEKVHKPEDYRLVFSDFDAITTTSKSFNSDETTTTESSSESRTTNSDELSTELTADITRKSRGGDDKENLTTSTENPDTTETSSELTKTHENHHHEDEKDLMTISSALSRTTEDPKTKIITTTTKKVITPTATSTTTTNEIFTSAASNNEIQSTNPTTTRMTTKPTTSWSTPIKTTTKDDDDEELTASSSNPGIFRVSTTFNPSSFAEDDKFRYNTFPDIIQHSTDAIEVTTTKSQQNFSDENADTNSSGLGVITAVISVIVLLSLVALIYFFIKRRNQQKTNQRCRPVPVGLDAYSLDNVSVYNSVRRKANALRASKRSYDNSAFEDPTLKNNVLDFQSLKEFIRNRKSVEDEFKHIPQVTARIDDVPDNCEEKNRFANVLPLSSTRVMLKRINDDEKSEYINANYVKGPKDTTNYYIATQAPLEGTIADFWRMMWEQNSRVILMLTDFHENGIEKCAQYLPSSVVLDNIQVFGDFEVTLKSREVKEKYALSKLHLRNLQTKTWREITHFWYSWPERGCPTDDSSVINLLLESRTFLKATTAADNLDENSNMDDKEKVSTLDKTRSLQKFQGPLTVHCNNGVGRTGAIIACDIILRYLETPPRQIDIPQIVYTIRRCRASSIRTKDQYEFIYNIANAYAATLTTSAET